MLKLKELSTEWTKATGNYKVYVKGGAQEVFAHMSSNMKEAINPTPPPDTPQEPMKAEEAMEALVTPRRDWTAQELLDEYAKYLNDWIEWLGALQEEPTASWKSH